MSANREKTSNVMGITVSVLLHGIFFAGCLALDASSLTHSSPSPGTQSEIQQAHSLSTPGEVKS